MSDTGVFITRGIMIKTCMKELKVWYNLDMRQINYFEAYLDDFDKIVIYMSKQSYEGNSRLFYLEDENGKLENLEIQTIEPTSRNYNKYTCKTKNPIEVGKNYHILHEYARRCPLKTGYITKLASFDEQFSYDGNDLGATYTKEKTVFKLWAPTAVKVTLYLDGEFFLMTRKERGVYEASITGDMEKKAYRYYILVDGSWQACEDPYGKSSLANSNYSIVVDIEKFKDEKPSLPELKHYTDAIIYEMNVRDFTAQNQNHDFKHSKEFLGVVEENENTIQKDIGFTYLKHLGITHVQLMPVMDFASVDENNPSVFYNWGYDPAQFMTPEGSYSSDPNDPYARIRELKEMVHQLHEAGIRVIFDVVFNHVFEMEDMPVAKSVPNYYFQMNNEGYYSNGSGCGNDFDSKRAMGRKYIIDCCRYLMEVYHVDGFRFDLMGILDVDTMNQVYEACHQIDKNVMIYGEGWNMPSFLDGEQRATIINDYKMPHIAHFSDRFRDVVKGQTRIEEVYQKGYCSGDLSQLTMMKDVLNASVSDQYTYRYFMEPVNVINYVECHDNQTCWDKLKECCKEDTRERRIMRQKMCIAAVLFAQGIPFIHSGQEFARTKYGKANTYNSKDDINWLNWERKDMYKTIVDYTKDCIRLRKNYACLRYPSTQMVQEHVSFSDINSTVLCYHIHDEQEDLTIMFNPSNQEFSYSFEGIRDLLFYNGGVDHEIVNGYISIQPLSVIVLRKGGSQ